MSNRRAPHASLDLSDRRSPSPSEWLSAARPRTLPAAVVPVMVGIGIARSVGDISIWRSIGAGVVALAVQVGTNFANDYGDGVRGADAARVGPMRLVASGKASPKLVRAAAVAAFGIAAAVGLVLALFTSPFVIILGACCIAAGWFYTAGPAPYGYRGLGEIFVFVFFGEVAVLGTTYIASRHIPLASVLYAAPVGMLAVSLLVVNNLRDIPSDTVASKRTLAVMLGDARTRRLYQCLVLGAFVLAACSSIFRHFAGIAVLALLAARRPLRTVGSGATGKTLIGALADTGALQLLFGLLFAIGIAI